MKKFLNWFKESNRWKHLVISIMIGALIDDIISTTICATLVGVALEYKDKSYGGKWDWWDLVLTIVPAIVINGIKTVVLLWIG